MTEEDLRTLIEQALFDVAPDLMGEEIDPKVTFRDQFDIDSMDFLNFVIGLHEKTGVAIPEPDYPKLESLEKSIEYLSRHLNAQ